MFTLKSKHLLSALPLLLSACIIQVPEGVLSAKPTPSSSPPVQTNQMPASPFATAVPTALPSVSLPSNPFKTPEPIPTPVPKRVFSLFKKEFRLLFDEKLGGGSVPPRSEDSPLYIIPGPGTVHYELMWKEGDLTYSAVNKHPDPPNSQKSRIRWTLPPERITEGDIIPMSASLEVLTNNITGSDPGAKIEVGWNTDSASHSWFIHGDSGNPVQMSLKTPVGTLIESKVTKPIQPFKDHFSLTVDAPFVDVIYHYQEVK